MATAFQINGLGSGVDTGAMLDALRAFRMRPVTLEQNSQSRSSGKLQAWQDVNLRLISLQASASSLTRTATFTGVKATIADTSVASVSATSSAASGTVALNVTQLAQARKLASSTFADAAEARGLTGSFLVNGKTVAVAADDSLNSLAQKINALGAGASASVVTIAPGQNRLTLSGLGTGLQNSLSLAESGGGTSLAALGLLAGGAAAARYSTTDANGTHVQSLGFGSGTNKLGEMMGLTTAAAGSFTINGATVSYDTATDTLTSLSDKINGLGVAGLTASVAGATDSTGNFTYRLKISNASAAPVFGGDAAGFLNHLGITQVGTVAANVLASAKDSLFALDGLTIQRGTNTISDALTGVTLTLQKEGAATNIFLNRDTSGTVAAVTNFVDSYNEVMGLIRDQSTFTTGSNGSSSPPLLGDFRLQQIQESLASGVSQIVQGLPAGFATLTDLGITFNDDNTLALNKGTLTSALSKDADAVAKRFGTFGASSNAAVTFLSAGNSALATTTGYTVNITTAARQAEVVGGTAANAALPGSETLTFSGGLFTTPTTVALAAGNTLAQTIAQINNSVAGQTVTAYEDGGRLGLRSKNHGVTQTFSVVSDQATGYSGLGTTVLTGTGINVAGTINGETATGSGQILTGNESGGAANGLAVKVTGTTLGNLGTVTLQRGAAAQASLLVSQFIDVTNGSVTLEQNALKQSIDDSTKRITDLTASVDAYIANLQAQFTRMESQISKLKAQSSQLAATINSLNRNSDNNDN